MLKRSPHYFASVDCTAYDGADIWRWRCLGAGLLACSLIVGYGSAVRAESIDIGINIGQQAVTISRRDSSAVDVADLEGDFSYSVAVSAKSSDNYFNNESPWGYFFQFDYSQFEVHKQVIPGSEETRDVGTRLKGYSVYLVPVMFYNFSRFDDTKWHKKLGIGVGVGRLSIKGNFRILSLADPNIGKEVVVDASGISYAIGVLFAFEKHPHNIILQNFGPTLDAGDYSYLQHNIIISYRYSFEFDL